MSEAAASIYLEERREDKIIRPTLHHKEQPAIRYDIPLPKGVETRGGPRNFSHFYPFEDMEPGGSFWVPGKSNGCTCSAVSRFAKKTGWRFVTRSQSQEGLPNSEAPRELHGIRVWRIS